MNRGSARRKPTELRAQQRETVRALILDAAEDRIASRGLAHAPLAEIARGAGVAVGTLYNYFTDRDALIEALFTSRRGTLRPLISAAVRASTGLAFEPRLRALVRDLLAAFDTHRRFIKVAIETEHVRLAPTETAADLRAAIDDVMRAGAAEGVLRRDQTELASIMLAGALKSVVLRRAADDAPFVADAAPMVALFLDGVRAG